MTDRVPIVCFSIQICLYYIGSVFGIFVTGKNEATQMLSRWY